MDELIEIIEKELSYFRCCADDIKFKDAIRGLIDLYNQEKEKNRTLETLLQGNLFEKYKYYRKLADSYQANCISKDKI